MNQSLSRTPCIVSVPLVTRPYHHRSATTTGDGQQDILWHSGEIHPNDFAQTGDGRRKVAAVRSGLSKAVSPLRPLPTRNTGPPEIFVHTRFFSTVQSRVWRLFHSYHGIAFMSNLSTHKTPPPPSFKELLVKFYVQQSLLDDNCDKRDPSRGKYLTQPRSVQVAE